MAPALLGSVRGVRVLRSRTAGGPWFVASGEALLPADSGQFRDAMATSDAALWYALEIVRADGDLIRSLPIRVTGTYASRLAWLEPIPMPRPGGSVTIRYDLAREAARARLEIFDVRGRRLRVLQSGRASAGSHAVVWDGAGELSRGIYVVRLQADGLAASRKLAIPRRGP
jgi:hypothetical protein